MSSDNDIAIRVRGLGKCYSIAHNQQKFTTAAEAFMYRLRHPLEHQERESFWALKDVSFDVKRGDVVGIIGRNGAGKSTLLKILSRITEPTEGEIDLYGRVGSLLEVGTGFHPELTGRENIYLNGAILGMKKKEIDRQFDAIVDFAGVEQFLDTPVKRYSSGMYVRLAFAVAAHLRSEILVVDEVLAVGDAEFQKKCLGKMKDVASGGRTVLFVSHNMAAIEGLCNRAVLMEAGQVLEEGCVSALIARYISEVLPMQDYAQLANRTDRAGSGCLRFTGFRLEDPLGMPLAAVVAGQTVVVVLEYEVPRDADVADVDVGFSFATATNSLLFVLYSSFTGVYFHRVPCRGEFRCVVERFPLAEGTYLVGARATVRGLEADWPREAIALVQVLPGDFYEAGHAGFGTGAPLLVDGKWSVIAPEYEGRLTE